MVRVLPDPPSPTAFTPRVDHGAVAQLGEHLLCKQGVTGSIPVSSTSFDAFLWILRTLKNFILPDVEVQARLFENLGRNKRLALAELDVSLRQLGEILSVDRLGGNFGLYDQANKRLRWMPWQSEAMKDVTACEKLRGAGNMH